MCGFNTYLKIRSLVGTKFRNKKLFRISDKYLRNIQGDGTEDISCRMDSQTWLPTEAPSGQFTAEEAEGFYTRLREYFIGYLVFPAVFCKNPNFPIKIGCVPPIINPVVAGKTLYDTEFEKDSHILKNKHELYGSQQKLMSCLRSGQLVMSQLDGYSSDQISALCKKLGFQNLSRWSYRKQNSV